MIKFRTYLAQRKVKTCHCPIGVLINDNSLSSYDLSDNVVFEGSFVQAAFLPGSRPTSQP